MAKFLTIIGNLRSLANTITTRTGVGDSDKLISLNSSGYVDKSFIEKVFFHARQTSTQTVTGGALIPVSMTGIIADSHSQLNSTGVLTVSKPGFYHLDAGIYLTGYTTPASVVAEINIVNTGLSKNISYRLQQINTFSATSANLPGGLNIPLDLNDVLTLKAYCSGNASIDFFTGLVLTSFSGFLVA